jgi:hypothetical protein
MIVLMFGWFPFMFISAWGSKLAEGYGLSIAMIGFFICIVGGFISLSFGGQSYDNIWKSFEELEKEIEKHKTSRMEYEKARDRFIRKILEDDRKA